MKNQSLEVVWADAWHNDSYATPAEVETMTPHMVTSYGLCVRNDKLAVVLVQDKTEDGRYRDYKFIPRGMVQKVRVLR